VPSRRLSSSGSAGTPSQRPTRGVELLLRSANAGVLSGATLLMWSLSPLVLRSIVLPLAAIGALLLLALGVLLITSWNGLRLLEPVQQHLEQLAGLRDAEQQLGGLLIGPAYAAPAVAAQDVRALQATFAQLLALNGHLEPATPERLRAAHAALGELANDADPLKAELLAVLGDLREVLTLEHRAHGALVTNLSREVSTEFTMAAAVLIGVLSSDILILALLRRRIFLPLKNLHDLLARLAGRDYSTMESEKTDPMLRPLVENYNHLVERLAELEEENATRRESLEQQVRSVTQALLQQQRSLAVAQRLAAVGEVAAQIAHELRNPLAGIQVALTNMKQEWKELPEISDRLEVIVDELRRVTGLLNGLLDQSRHAPEPLETVWLSKELSGPLALARYQISEDIRLVNDIPNDLVCLLPKNALRQAVLNLVLNAAQAIGDQGGQVTIEAFEKNSQLILTVSDDGPGFPPELVGHAGRPFQTRRPGGTGLGLAMVRRFVNTMHGEIQLSNLSPHGARVTFTLPCQEHHA
jgi:two-component system, NtrC family, sensor kinase